MLENDDHSEESIIKEVKGAGVIKVVDRRKIRPQLIERDNKNKELIKDEEKRLEKNEDEIEYLIKDFDVYRKNYNSGELLWDTVEDKVGNLVKKAKELLDTSELPSQEEQLKFHIESMEEFLKINKEKEITKAFDGLINDFNSICEDSNNGELPWDTVKEKVENLSEKAKKLLDKSGLSPRKKEIENHIIQMKEFLNNNQLK